MCFDHFCLLIMVVLKEGFYCCLVFYFYFFSFFGVCPESEVFFLSSSSYQVKQPDNGMLLCSLVCSCGYVAQIFANAVEPVTKDHSNERFPFL